MSSQEIIASQRENAEIYHGDDLFKEKSRELLERCSLPNGLLPLNDVVEVGYNESTGFVWLKQKNKKQHKFRSIDRSVTYDTEVTAFMEDRRMKRVTGVKSKELLIWLTVSDIFIDDPSSGKITFATPTGFSRTFPVSAFEVDDEK
ncbi:uncharacterized protein LOC132279624 [Cornus florida]|uniref:uncharacterized protein LOC132279624 n=1 Tax=Cornus florida TaxID=4283 RepID=UPI002897F52E|nr:uncharacterized protein LOC132279624 [Cornus florida]